ncbi:MAG: cache domain-containing protein, partial [Candidatus Binatia bacterium]
MKGLSFGILLNKLLPRTIRGKLIFWFLILSPVPILGIGLVAYYNSKASLEREIINKLNAVADNKSYILKSSFKAQQSDAQSLSNNAAVRDLLSPGFRIVYPDLAAKTDQERTQRAKNLISALQETNPAYADVLLADKGGTVVIASSRAMNQEGKSLSEIGLPRIEADQSFVSPVLFSPIAQQHVFMMSAPIHDNNGVVVGHAILEVELRPIHRLMEERSGLGETGEVIIVDRQRRMLTQSRFSKESTILKTVPDSPAVQAGLEGKTGEVFQPDYRGVSVIESFRPIP